MIPAQRDDVPVLAYVTLSSPQANRLVSFYQALLASDVTFDEAPYTVLGTGAPMRMAFQQVDSHTAATPVHVDLSVGSMEAVGQRIEELGGRLGDHHSGVGSRWRQAFDPDGNPVCLLARPEPA